MTSKRRNDFFWNELKEFGENEFSNDHATKTMSKNNQFDMNCNNGKEFPTLFDCFAYSWFLLSSNETNL